MTVRIRTLLFRLGLVLLALMPAATARAEPIYVAAAAMPVLLEAENRGIVARVARQIGREAGMDIQFRLYPPEDVPVVFQEGRADAMLTRSTRDLGYAHAPIRAFFTSRIYAFRLEGSSRIYRIYHLRGKRVGMTKGYSYDPDFMAQLRKVKVKVLANGSDVVGFKMLARDQIFAFLAEEYAARAALGVSDAQGIIHDSRAPLWKKPMSLLFPRDDVGKARAKRFDRAYMQLRSDGRYERMLAAGAEG